MSSQINRTQKHYKNSLHGLFQKGPLIAPKFVGTWEECRKWREQMHVDQRCNWWIGHVQGDEWVSCIEGRPPWLKANATDSSPFYEHTGRQDERTRNPVVRYLTLPYEHKPAHHELLDRKFDTEHTNDVGITSTPKQT